MLKLLALLLMLMIQPFCKAQTDEDLTLTFDDEIPDFMEPEKPAPKKLKTRIENVDTYCLCKCIKTKQNPNKAKIFKGKKKNQSCLCECAA